MRLKKIVVPICILIAAGSITAQNMKSLEFQVGSFNPKDTPAGIIWDVKYGIAVDEAVDIHLGVAWFHKSYEEVSTVAVGETESGVETTTKEAALEYTTNLLPITASATIHLPMNSPLGIYFGAGLSWQFLFNKENNYDDEISETRTYNGGGWNARVGAEYELGSKSSLIAEMFYNNCKVKGNKDKKEGLPVWDEVDVTGLGFKIGLRVEIY